MKTEELFLTREQSKHLQELGLDMSDAAFCWMKISESCYDKLMTNEGWEIKICSHTAEEVFSRDMYSTFPQFQEIPTYTLQEVLNKLPKEIENTRHEIFWLNFYYDSISYQDYDGCLIIRFDLFPSPLQSLYNLLCWVLENGYLK